VLGAYLAVRYPGVLSRDECAAYVARTMGARGAWTSNFGGAQFTLGRAWYTHLEEDREASYFAGAAASDALVRRVVPGMQERLLGIIRALVGAEVVARAGWCGPGIHIFPAGSEVAETGGVVHYDTEGLTELQRGARARALTFILMLQPAETGGGLAVWDQTYDGEDFPEDPGPAAARATIDYEVGELVVIDSYRLHQIEPFGGGQDRVSATVHAVETSIGSWEAWF
jgi:hypothetical protein